MSADGLVGRTADRPRAGNHPFSRPRLLRVRGLMKHVTSSVDWGNDQPKMEEPSSMSNRMEKRWSKEMTEARSNCAISSHLG